MDSFIPNNLFGPGGCLTSMAIRNYLDGTLGLTGRRQVEEHILKCRLCAEALRGFKNHAGKKFIQSDLEFLSRKIRRTYTPENTMTGRKLPVLLVFSIAASMAILVSVFYIFRQYQVQPKVQTQEVSDSARSNAMQDTAKFIPGSSE